MSVRTCDGLSMCQSASSIEFLAATEGAAGRFDHSEKVEKDDLSIPKYVWSTSDDQHFDGRGEARLAKET